MSTISRSKAAEQGREAVRILAEGHYVAADGTRVRLGESLQSAVAGTVEYPPATPLPHVVPTGRETVFEVANEGTLTAAARLAVAGLNPVALNFASARHPGGGFQNGARAQEESLCRSSGLYACIRTSPMYAFHAPERGGWYSDYAVYSPGVPVFRNDDGDLLAEPYLCGFVTAPAVNAGAVGVRQKPDIPAEMERRVEKVLAVMAGHGHDSAVLGAWGCGVFKNEPGLLADLFRKALTAEFAGAFSRVVFAVLDWSEEEKFIGPFKKRFAI